LTRPRYLIAVAEDERLLKQARAMLDRAAGPAFCLILDEQRVLLMTCGEQALAVPGVGAVIGPVHDPNGVVGAERSTLKTAAESRGRSLIDDHWGGYVALILGRAPDEVEVVRAPLGDLPCYWARVGGLHLLSSDLSLMRAAELPLPLLDAAALARHLAREDLRTSETCLGGVYELRGGERMTLGRGGMDQSILWSPWTFASRERQLTDPADAANMVRDAAFHCVAARAATFNPILLKLSGGLDSSIVAACLKQSGAAFDALNLVTENPAGDEREHASVVARAAGVPLLEHYRNPAKVDLRHSDAFRLPRPTARAFTQESRRIAGQVAAELGSQAVFDGGGGDNIFCSLNSARPAADCLLAAPEQFRESCASIARLAQASIAQVAWRAWRTKLRRNPAYAWGADMRFLSRAAVAEAEKAPAHPWLTAPGDALPGKAAHVALIAAAQSVAEGFDAEDELPVYSPLISQPLVETCLRVPSWLWFERGLNRAVARRAFSKCLPLETVQRRSKGAPDCFIAELFEVNRPAIRTMLMDGALRREGLLDVVALETALDDQAPVEGHDYLRIMQLVDAEAWATAWTAS